MPRFSKTIKNKIQIKADFTSPYCLIKGNSCSNLTGNFSWNSQSLNLDLEAVFDTPLARSTLRLGSKGGETDMAIHDIPAAYLANILAISNDAPLAGIVSSGKLKINAGFISGQAQPGRHPGPASDPALCSQGNH